MELLTKIIIAGCIGGFMGVLTHAKRNKTIKKPKNYKNTFFPGFLIDVAFGAVGAIVAILFADPNGMERVILTAILGGYAGENAITMVEQENKTRNTQEVSKVDSRENKVLEMPKDKKEQ